MKNMILFVAMLLALATTAFAQVASPTVTPANPNAYISWPPPVYVLRGEFTVRGTVNEPGMQGYFVEIRALNPDLTASTDETQWFPVILPSTTAVLDDVLGTWDTSLVEDGVYEMRLTVNVANSATPVSHVVSPLRIENVLPPFVATATPQATATPLATITPTIDPTPRVTATLNANVRSGDSTLYPVVGSLAAGSSAQIVGISNTGSNWYLIDLNGQRGFISPTVVTVSGNTAGLQLVAPPPVPVTPTPVATATPTSAANLVVSGISVAPNPPICNQTYNLTVRILNNGTAATNTSSTLGVSDVHIATGTVAAQSIGGFPVLQPGQTFDVVVPLTAAVYYNEGHRINISLDPGAVVIENNEGDNGGTFDYILQKGSCP